MIAPGLSMAVGARDKYITLARRMDYIPWLDGSLVFKCLGTRLVTVLGSLIEAR